jgi:hypothetical protein
MLPRARTRKGATPKLAKLSLVVEAMAALVKDQKDSQATSKELCTTTLNFCKHNQDAIPATT